jgi:hypothetical protein
MKKWGAKGSYAPRGSFSRKSKRAKKTDPGEGTLGSAQGPSFPPLLFSEILVCLWRECGPAWLTFKKKQNGIGLEKRERVTLPKVGSASVTEMAGSQRGRGQPPVFDSGKVSPFCVSNVEPRDC